MKTFLIIGYFHIFIRWSSQIILSNLALTVVIVGAGQWPPLPSPSSPFLIIKLKLVSMAMTAWSQYSRHCNCSIMHRQNCQEDKVCLLSTNICCAHLSSHHNLVQKISSPSPPSANSEIKFSISCNLKMHSTLLPSEKQGKNFCPNFLSL